MEAIRMIKGRRSIRSFTDEKISEEVINKLVEIARYSPSWANFQVARYHIVQNDAIISKIAEKGVNKFIYNIDTLKKAPNVLVLTHVEGLSGKLCINDGELDLSEGAEIKYVSSKHDSWEIFDAGLAAQTFCLAAHANKIGTCIMGVIDDKSIAEIIELPKNETVAALIVFGKMDDDEEVEVPDRHDVEKLLTIH